MLLVFGDEDILILRWTKKTRIPPANDVNASF